MRVRFLLLSILSALSMMSLASHADDAVQFNTDILDVNDKNNVDLNQFSRGGYIMPGEYTMSVKINKQSLDDQNITFLPPESDPKGSVACLSPKLVAQFALKENVAKQLTWWHDSQCLNFDSLKGMIAKGDLGTSTLYISIPQAWMQFSSENWDPPARWDDGIPGIILDYNANVQATRRGLKNADGDSYSASANGTVGANIGAWRFRADWQASHSHTGDVSDTQQLKWSRYYLYRTVRRWGAKLTAGEDYLTSDLFDNVRFAGVGLSTDDNQLPPNLRGYAPEVTGVARTNAKVTISQQGRVLYETQVAPGPFRIQTLNDATSGTLDVKVAEQDGSEQHYQVNTASIPYLTRPGMVRYKMSAGRPDDLLHHSAGPMFATGEFSWGVNNGWSLYGGGMLLEKYIALSLGVGRDLMALGAVSFDVTTTKGQVGQQGSLSGNSYKLSYSKRFDSLDSEVTFAGYRFSERNYMSLNEFLNALRLGMKAGGSKEMYTISFNKQFKNIGLSTYFNISRLTYWDNTPTNVRYSVSLAKYFDIGPLKNVNVSLTAFRSQLNNKTDRGAFLGLSVPYGNQGSISYNGNYSKGSDSHRVTYFDQINDHNSYSVGVNGNQDNIGANASFAHQGDMAEFSANASFNPNSYSSLGMSMRGGITATPYGAALHRVNQFGGTRLMVDTGGVSGVPVKAAGSAEHSNIFGKAVLGDVNDYYRNSASIDIDKLADNVDVARSMIEATLTQGAIGYRKFDVLSGEKALTIIKLVDGSTPPFGATVYNLKGQQTGIVGEDGSTYLSGMNPLERMDVKWDGEVGCSFTLPKILHVPSLLLPCTKMPPAGDNDKKH